MKAFPLDWIEVKQNTTGSSHFSNYEEIKHTETGMDLRDYFAAMAMQGMLSENSGIRYSTPDLAKFAYEISDAMLEHRK